MNFGLQPMLDSVHRFCCCNANNRMQKDWLCLCVRFFFYPGGKIKQLLLICSRFVGKKTFSKIASDRIGSVIAIFCVPYLFSSNCKVLHFNIISGSISIDSIWNRNRNYMMSNELAHLQIPKIFSLNVLFNYQIKHKCVAAGKCFPCNSS